MVLRDSFRNARQFLLCRSRVKGNPPHLLTLPAAARVPVGKWHVASCSCVKIDFWPNWVLADCFGELDWLEEVVETKWLDFKNSREI